MKLKKNLVKKSELLNWHDSGERRAELEMRMGGAKALQKIVDLYRSELFIGEQCKACPQCQTFIEVQANVVILLGVFVKWSCWGSL